MRLSPCVLVQPDGWARGEREGYGEPCDVTSLSLNHLNAIAATPRRQQIPENILLGQRVHQTHARHLEEPVRLGIEFGSVHELSE